MTYKNKAAHLTGNGLKLGFSAWEEINSCNGHCRPLSVGRSSEDEFSARAEPSSGTRRCPGCTRSTRAKTQREEGGSQSCRKCRLFRRSGQGVHFDFSGEFSCEHPAHAFGCEVDWVPGVGSRPSRPSIVDRFDALTVSVTQWLCQQYQRINVSICAPVAHFHENTPSGSID